ncbi:MAG: AMP phosphorylase [Candidatus Komeilibacteria bacterium RIFOXYC1_FULL_37_11]|uniref:AMP phosphorylase n=1 Tax=Candidatus Komeilibacteria bacterium RIFOXYC1_FULL_37_11 TaxID=1798555 RepID=A0A1G2BZP1_9BACT|nr:MAG: AMP phosphorylase [Candidatus Komeilibacteria bacterium RIFOXYC1_FULL_37_11]OGY95529.1 MAG: AMP phosphorylase [Candidatus Komeilibacteria bacterium RIFOXYD1_FULL_37_29]
MPYYLKIKKLDIKTGQSNIALLNVDEAIQYGIKAGDKIKISWQDQSVIAEANTSQSRVQRGQIGLYKDIWEATSILPNTIVEIEFLERAQSIVAIKNRLLGKKLKYKDFYQIFSDIANGILTRTETTYFVASSFIHDYSDQELYFMTKAMAETGEMLKFSNKIVVDKHSVGGLAGNRTTMVVIPILASLGLIIPKTSSRAITSPAGTADTMEVLAPVSFSAPEIKKIVKKAGGCLVWGGGLNLAPADDKILQVSYPLSLEPYDKMLVSIMAKKVATGVTHLIIDMPVGKTTKIPNMKIAKELARKFKYIGKKFNIKMKVIMVQTEDPVGMGVGPALEARDVLRVLQQKDNYPADLANKSIHLAGELLELCGKAKKGHGATMAWKALESGAAWKKMQEIIKAQGGKFDIDPNDIVLGAHKKYYNASKSGCITFTDNKAINTIARILGAPKDKLAGIYLNKEYNDHVKKGERLFTLYARSQMRLKLTDKALEKMSIFKIGK